MSIPKPTVEVILGEDLSVWPETSLLAIDQKKTPQYFSSAAGRAGLRKQLESTAGHHST